MRTIDLSLSKQPFTYLGGTVVISVVAYQHPAGIPARLCAGLLAAIELYHRLPIGVAQLRIVDPSPIAAYCNGWSLCNETTSILQTFCEQASIHPVFDPAQPPCKESLDILQRVGERLMRTENPAVREMIQRIRESGRIHGGANGEQNALIYMAAHPFSWLDQYHPLIWQRRYPRDGCQYVNMLSQAESRFSLIRDELRQQPDYPSGLESEDLYMKICNVPCYIPLPQEPTYTEAKRVGWDACLAQYHNLKRLSENHRRATKDMEALIAFLGK